MFKLHDIAEYVISKGELEAGRQILVAADLMEEMADTLGDVSKGHELVEYSQDGTRRKLLVTPQTEKARSTLSKVKEWNDGRA